MAQAGASLMARERRVPRAVAVMVGPAPQAAPPRSHLVQVPPPAVIDADLRALAAQVQVLEMRIAALERLDRSRWWERLSRWISARWQRMKG